MDLFVGLVYVLHEEEIVMAYMIGGSLDESMRGALLPHKAGEYCGNVLRKDIVVSVCGRVTILNKGAFSDRDVKLKIGKPAEIGGRFSSQELEKYGYVGLYLDEDIPLVEDAVEIETDVFAEDVVSGERLPQKPVDFSKIRRRGI